MARYFEWNYNTNETIEFERVGDCNGCGECCKALIRFVVQRSKPEEPADGREYAPTTDRAGVWSEVDVDGRPRYLIKLTSIDAGQLRCEHLDDDNQCRVHLDKTRICAEWPMHPTHVTPFARCSYQFREIARWPIDQVT